MKLDIPTFFCFILASTIFSQAWAEINPWAGIRGAEKQLPRSSCPSCNGIVEGLGSSDYDINFNETLGQGKCGCNFGVCKSTSAWPSLVAFTGYSVDECTVSYTFDVTSADSNAISQGE